MTGIVPKKKKPCPIQVAGGRHVRRYWVVLSVIVLLLSGCAHGDRMSEPTSEPVATPSPAPALAPAPTPSTTAEFQVVHLDIAPSEVAPGDSARVMAYIKNIGSSRGIYAAKLIVDGMEVETKDVAVSPGSIERVTFSITKREPGTYRISMGRLDANLIVKHEVPASLTELEATYTELFQELLKLPEFEDIDAKDSEAIEDIAHLALNPTYRPAFEAMLSEGIKGKRKYCTPLQALLWIAYDKDFEKYNPLRSYSLARLLDDAWESTTTSRKYTSERWRNFDDVIDRLSSPHLVNSYIEDNFSYDYEGYKTFKSTGRRVTQTPQQTFSRKMGQSFDWAGFALYCLLQNGYKYDDFEVHRDGSACLLQVRARDYIPGRENWVCLYADKGKFYTIDYGQNQNQRGINGPFSTVAAASAATYPHGLGEYALLNLSYTVTKSFKP